MDLPIDLRQWAIRHHVGADALDDLARLLRTAPLADTPPAEGSEGRVQSLVRLAAPHYDMTLWRNNVGALQDKRGVPVRFGLANDTKALNSRLKSGDLIGWRRLAITPAMVGSTVAQFATVECKEAGWKWSGDEHEQAQGRWAALVAADGGYARFATGSEALA